ncbi:PEP-CTERM sorting domain-containing protein [Methylobacillus gramineus]|uniref:PEP-CTERM sorting domain-containing protein n=1 Tax=Methylobacillus gramineus TaxID=755169 RepID=UPI001CFFC585|nr:PEP-CTERM sorting domain-containing protein [Methylobacillus gramineus]MCB5186222.1 PEP-CTERM sorting domain-containing protein [Methylobacillus gramineus]
MNIAYSQSILALTMLVATSLSQAATPTSQYFSDVTGSLTTDGFNQLTASRLGAGTTGIAAIVDGINSNVPAGDAEFKRTYGNAYPASLGLYQWSGTPYSTFSISDATLLPNLGSIVFQSEVFPGGNQSLGGQGGLAAAISDVYLSYNGGTQLLAASSFSLSDAPVNEDSPFYDPANPVAEGAVGYFTWDFSGISDPITSYEISFLVHLHSSVVAFQVDQIAAVPEPSEYALLLGGLALVGFMARRKKNTQA